MAALSNGVPSRGRTSWLGDAGELARIYQDHGAAIHALARTAAPSSADDLTLEVFLRLGQHPEHYDETRWSLRAYLVATTYDCAARLRNTDRTSYAHRASATGPRPPGEDLAANLELDRALALLDDAERSAILTTCYGGCTYHEAALVLGVAEDRLAAAIRSGLRRLHAAMATTTASQRSAFASGAGLS